MILFGLFSQTASEEDIPFHLFTSVFFTNSALRFFQTLISFWILKYLTAVRNVECEACVKYLIVEYQSVYLSTENLKWKAAARSDVL